MAAREIEYADEIVEFSVALDKEQTRRRYLEDTLSSLEESNAIDMSRIRKECEHALASYDVYKNERQ